MEIFQEFSLYTCIYFWIFFRNKIKQKKFAEISDQTHNVISPSKTQQRSVKKRKRTNSSCERLIDQTETAESLPQTEVLDVHKKCVQKTENLKQKPESAKMRKKKRKKLQESAEANEKQTSSNIPTSAIKQDDKKLLNGKKKKDGKRKKKKKPQISNERLQAYGINPKKLKYLKINRQKT